MSARDRCIDVSVDGWPNADLFTTRMECGSAAHKPASSSFSHPRLGDPSLLILF